MAYDENLETFTLNAAADFSTTGIYRFGVVNTSGQAALASSAGRVDFVVYDNPAAIGRECKCAKGLITKIELGGTVTAGDQLQSGSSGVATSGSTNTPGIALESGVSGDIISMLWSK